MQGDPSGVQQEGIEDQSQRMVADADADTDAILNRIPAPAVVIQQGDPYSLQEQSAGDARHHPVVTRILLAIIALGFMLIIVGMVSHGWQEPKQFDGFSKPSDGQEFVNQLVVGLGLELAASAAMLVLFYQYIDKCTDNQTTLIMASAFAVAAALVGFPALFFHGVSGGLMASVGIEIFGAMVIFAVLDSVVDALKKSGKDSPETGLERRDENRF